MIHCRDWFQYRELWIRLILVSLIYNDCQCRDFWSIWFFLVNQYPPTFPLIWIYKLKDYKNSTWFILKKWKVNMNLSCEIQWFPVPFPLYNRLNSGGAMISELCIWYLNGSCSDCRAPKIMIQTRSNFLGTEHRKSFFNFCVSVWVVWHPLLLIETAKKLWSSKDLKWFFWDS